MSCHLMPKLSGGGRAGGGGTDGGAQKRDILHRTHERAHIHTRAGGEGGSCRSAGC